MTSNQKIRRARRWALAVIAVLAMGVFATRPNIASETQDQFWHETGQCLNWFFTDFERHQANCIGPGIPPGTYNDIEGGNNGGGGGAPCESIAIGDAGNAGSGSPCSPCDDRLVGLGAGGAVDPCRNVSGYIAPWVLDMFRQDVPETAYL